MGLKWKRRGKVSKASSPCCCHLGSTHCRAQLPTPPARRPCQRLANREPYKQQLSLLRSKELSIPVFVIFDAPTNNLCVPCSSMRCAMTSSPSITTNVSHGGVIFLDFLTNGVRSIYFLFVTHQMLPHVTWRNLVHVDAFLDCFLHHCTRLGLVRACIYPPCRRLTLG